MKTLWKVALLIVLAVFFTESGWSEDPALKASTFDMGKLRPFDSKLKVTFPDLAGTTVAAVNRQR